ncbi:MAG: hypothetical protein CMP89_11045 [Gammaproteobacteria bacterium]|nr:hypothetical protein [Gammaproteobacteria bacterium]
MSRIHILVFISFLLSASVLKIKADPGQYLDTPISADNSQTYQFEIRTQSGYTDQVGRNVIDVIEGYEVNLALTAETKAGRPVIGLKPDFDLTGSSELIPPGESTPLVTTDESGILEFGVTAGQQGMDKLTVSFGENEATVYFNIISLKINDFPSAPTLLGGLNWSQLMKTELSLVEDEVKVDFPNEILEQDGELVRVSGFMMPMDSSLKQKHFLLTSSPPHCFFHIPGGPAGVIEVFSEDGVESSWGPVVVEGKFELVSAPEMGVIYKLHQAQPVNN